MSSITRALAMFEDSPDSTGTSVKLGDLRALSSDNERLRARVEELEGRPAYLIGQETGRLEGLNEAKDAYTTAYGMGLDWLETVEAIDALKGDGND